MLTPPYTHLLWAFINYFYYNTIYIFQIILYLVRPRELPLLRPDPPLLVPLLREDEGAGL